MGDSPQTIVDLDAPAADAEPSARRAVEWLSAQGVAKRSPDGVRVGRPLQRRARRLTG
ncbi:hypothetical protein ACIPM2_18140 [Streptomyces sp. NPDC086081]|uniref:hypothetical protein n=1 Tax=Streptomyces sp. NPDC086081 TaxID=3365749 RepID=UPI00382A6ACD